MATVYLSLGSNVGGRSENIRKAIQLLEEKNIKIRQISSFYETEPMHNENQPAFINCCVVAEVSVSPDECLKTLKTAEKELGRDLDAARYAPRIIDIDLLYYDNIIIDSTGLIIPHPHMRGRRFVLAPLSEIAPDFRDPLTGFKVKEALNAPECRGKVTKLESK